MTWLFLVDYIVMVCNTIGAALMIWLFRTRSAKVIMGAFLIKEMFDLCSMPYAVSYEGLKPFFIIRMIGTTVLTSVMWFTICTKLKTSLKLNGEEENAKTGK